MKASLRIAVLTIFAALIVSQSAQASLLLEPYLGYVSGEAKQTTTAKFTGTEYGARVGWSSMIGLAVGGEYAAMSTTDDSSPKNDLKSSDLGVFVAYKFPIMLRAYATYFPSSEIKTSSSVVDGTFKSGNAMKLGVGFTGLPFININLEYITSNYSKFSSGGVEGDLSPKLTTSSYAISISAPFNFL